ncbi:Cytochrome c oxidase assembly protein cox15 [Steccherinum ochraceum]|uniref:Cytochrome c oxidase assembly protein cox15 n=1 Tax=Steccherinum ochraceum TaxID=92696 RepID=A0A4R0S2C0_9APHY|nr:Cytochrome c oxidase assembly protein cox15 [Steccherinum ochraceum]
MLPWTCARAVSRRAEPSLLRGLHQVLHGSRSTASKPLQFAAHRVQLLSKTPPNIKSIFRQQHRPLSAIFASSPRSPFDSRYFSSNSAQALAPEASSESAAEEAPEPQPVLTPPAVAYWLLCTSGLVFAVTVVGAITRLTESGLSITEWRPITGILPPLSAAQWEEEFRKYQATPEFKLINHSIDIHQFKSIFYMEWGHRVLGRLIGISFVLPLVYFATRRRVLSRQLVQRLGLLGLLIGFQGALGWYMVKSGLEESLMETPGAVPRVSQYRLAAHLGAAFLLYAGMFGTGLNILYDWRYAQGAGWSGMKTEVAGTEWKKVLENPLVKRFSRYSKALTALVFVTALSGAFVAGLDAGLLYNEFPLMGGRLMPPSSELFSSSYAKKADGSDYWWRNIFENPATVQFNHRCLAMTTYASTTALWLLSKTPAMKAALPPMVQRFAMSAFAMVNVQLALGISTLLYLVPVSLAAAHQAGSVMLFTTVIHLLVSLRRPGAAARAYRAATAKAKGLQR